jgi:hypothetical protein
MKLVQENLNNILKPKSDENILNDFKKADVTDQINLLIKNKYSIISEEYCPLIYKIKEYLKTNSSFGITEYDYIWGITEYRGVEFKIWFKGCDLHYIIIAQYNNFDYVEVSYGSLTKSLPEKIYNLSELKNYINNITLNTIGKTLI